MDGRRGIVVGGLVTAFVENSITVASTSEALVERFRFLIFYHFTLRPSGFGIW